METNDNAALPVPPPSPVPSRIRMTGDRAALFAALAKAQAGFKPILRTETADVEGVTATGNKYKYAFSYAPLENVLDATREALAANGLAIIQPLCSAIDGGRVLHTWLVHASGASIEIENDIPETNTVQKLGSAITYLRRYVVQALLGVSAEEDDDGNHADGNQRTKTQPRPQPSSQPPQRPQPAAPSQHGPVAQKPADAPAPELITAEQDKAIGELFRSLKFSRTAATEFVQKTAGKGPSQLTREDGEKVLAALRAQATPPAAAS